MRSLKTYAAMVLLFLALTASVFSCEKDIFNDEDGLQIPNNLPSPAVVFSVNDQAKNGTYQRTVLGDLRQNPYTVENLAAAMNELYDTRIEKVPTTHLYLKFEPRNNEELVALEAYDFDLYDFPLEREVIEMGDYYFEPAGKEDYPTYWTVVKPDTELPAVPHELIAEVNLTESDPFLMRAAFVRTGNGAEIDDRFPLPPGLTIEEFMGAGNSSDCHPGCASWPCCLSGLLECYDDFVPDWCMNFDPECYPGMPDYPECLEGNEPDAPTLNDCGCVVSSNPRYPGGCVRVMDTELGYEGVKGVKVKAYNGWLTTQSTYTNGNGCWRIDRSFRGNGYFWVKFKDGRGTRIRGARGGTGFWEHLFTISDYVGVVAGPNFHNITISYDMWNEQGSQAHRYWSAATVNNRIHEYNDNVEQQNIATLPALDVYVGLNRSGGFALMTDYLDFGTLGSIVANGLGGSDHFGDYPLFNFLYSTTAGITAESVRRYIPDVMIGTNDNHSDHVSSTAFHELAHAGIFMNVGNDYWEDLAVAEIIAENQTGHPWGNASSNDAGHIAVMESWADHLADRFTHDKYGSQNNISEESYLVRLETTRNFSEGHIPIGIYQDLEDSSAGEPLSVDENGPWVGYVNDYISHITMRNIFSILDDQVTSPELLRQRILNDIVPGTSLNPQAVGALFDSYQ